ncbi:MAG: methyltransferase domain-containing protein, partial [Candidatus Promineifilaceae bacterium]
MLSLDRQNELREQYRQERPEWQPATEFYADLVRSRLEPSSVVLDLGCGRGGLVEQLNHPLNQIVGVDADIVSLREHRLSGKLPLMAALSDALPFAEESFDVVFASWVLEHLAQPGKMMAEIGRVLRPGGAFLFITPNKRHPLIWLNNLINRFSNLQSELVNLIYGRVSADTFPTFYRVNTSTEIRKLAAEAGMTLVVSQAIPDPTYLALRPNWFDTAVRLEDRLPSDRAVHLVGMVEK